MANMKINGEQIKEARERLHMTQTELAEVLGVSLRTVGSWERGESVPRSRMGAIREVLKMEAPDDGREELGRLIREELQDSGRGPIQVTAGWSSGNLRSFYGWKDGKVMPQERVRAMLEDALGWRRGTVTDILNAPITKQYTLSEIRDWARQVEPGAVSLKDLSSDVMLTELIRRFGWAQDRISELEAQLASGSNVVPLHKGTQREQSHFDLAASDEHVPGEDDRD